MKITTGKWNILLCVILFPVFLLTACGKAESMPVEEQNFSLKSLTVEAGAALPQMEELFEGRPSGTVVYDDSAVNVKVPGEYAVSLTADGEVFHATITVVDTVAPILECEGGLFLRGELSPEELIVSASDVTELTFTLQSAPDESVNGLQTVTIVAEDLGGNRTEAMVEVTFYDRELTMEATANPITENLLREMLGISPMEDDTVLLDGGYTGTTLVEIPGGEQMIVVMLTAEDTTAPTAEGVEYVGYSGYPLPIDTLLVNLQDATSVTIEAAEPDWNLEGLQNVTILLTDTAGNTAEVTSTLNLMLDEEPPRIYMARDFYAYADTTIQYFREIFAEDNADPEVVLTVDKSAINPREPGTYPITYTATDRAGNTTEATINLILKEQTISDEELDAVAREILNKITTDDMNNAEKA